MLFRSITPAEEFNGSSSNPVKDDDEKSISFNFRIIGLIVLLIIVIVIAVLITVQSEQETIEKQPAKEDAINKTIEKQPAKEDAINKTIERQPAKEDAIEKKIKIQKVLRTSEVIGTQKFFWAEINFGQNT